MAMLPHFSVMMGPSNFPAEGKTSKSGFKRMSEEAEPEAHLASMIHLYLLTYMKVLKPHSILQMSISILHNRNGGSVLFNPRQFFKEFYFLSCSVTVVKFIYRF